jgi:isopenicillin-N epimerase
MQHLQGWSTIGREVPTMVNGDRRRFLARLLAGSALPGAAAGLLPGGCATTGRARAERGNPTALETDSGTGGARSITFAADAPDEQVFAEARRHFLLPAGVAYFNTGTLGASPREVVDEVAGSLRKMESELADWDYSRQDGEPLTGYQELPEVRAALGRLVNARADEIALTQNATMGINFLASGLDLQSGDEVVTTDQEHVGGISPWRLAARRRGVVVKELPLLSAAAGPPGAGRVQNVIDLFAGAIGPRTRVMMVSHITSSLGVHMPVRELCALARQRGALAFVDGAQAVGQIAVDVQALGCDAYAASPHKWLLAPKGTGFLHVTRAVQDRLWTTLASRAFEDRERGAFRFMQYGTGSVPVINGLMAALRFVDSIGMARIQRWDAMLTRRLREGLARIPHARLASPADPQLGAAITTFGVEGQPARALQDALWQRRIRVRAQRSGAGVRLSAHLYNAPSDIDAVLEVVRAQRSG